MQTNLLAAVCGAICALSAVAQGQPLVETEHNDTVGWAEDGAGHAAFNGVISSVADYDVFKVTLPTATVLNAAVAPGAVPALDDPNLEILDVNGFSVDYNDDQSPTNVYPAIAIQLPAGTYYLKVGGYYSTVFGNYSLTMTTAPLSIPVAVPNVAVSGMRNGLSDPIYFLPIGAESHVVITCSNSVGMDLNLTLRLSNGHPIYQVEDSSLGVDPGLDTYLPAGVYYLTFGESSNLAGAFTFTANVTPGTMPSAPCGSAVTGNFVGDEMRAIYRLVLGSSQRVAFDTAGAGGNPSSDTYLTVFDRNLHEIAINDDTGTSAYASMELPLPAASYYVVLEPYPGSPGGYRLTGTCGLPLNATSAAFGRNAVSIANKGAPLLMVKSRNPNPFEIGTDLSTTGLDPQFALLDASGAVVMQDDDNGPGKEAYWGANLAEADYWLVLREWKARPMTCDVFVRPPLYFENAVSNRALVSLDRAGHSVQTFVSAAALPSGFPLPAPIQGKLWVDLSLFIALGPLNVPATGRIAWPVNFNPYLGLALQAVSIQAAPLAARMTDLVR